MVAIFYLLELKDLLLDVIASSAKNCGQFYVNHRWLGGMLD